MHLRLALAGLLVPVVFAGCASEPTPETPQTRLEQLSQGLPEFVYDVKPAVAEWVHLSTAYPKHDANLPNNAALRQHLETVLLDAGFNVTVYSVPGSIEGVELPALPGTDIYAIVATKNGSHPEHAIALGSHYDSQSATINAAYDNKAGTAIELATCLELAKQPMNKTLACMFFDGEERGLVGSAGFLNFYKAGKVAYTIDAYLGFDMVGLNWPGYTAWKFYLWHGQNNSTGALHINQQLAAHETWPQEGVEVVDHNERSSDEANFDAAGIPVVRYSGGRSASDYPMYHLPGDTVEYVDMYAGGRSNVESGFLFAISVAYQDALLFDRASPDELM